jgi:hypothetical protein
VRGQLRGRHPHRYFHALVSGLDLYLHFDPVFAVLPDDMRENPAVKLRQIGLGLGGGTFSQRPG